jgi:predicted DNA binding protein
MGLIAEFSVTSPELTLVEATKAVPSVTLELTAEHATDPERPVLFFWANGAELDAFDDALAADWSVTDVEMYTDLGDRRLYRAQLSDAVEIVSYPVWVEAGGVQLSATCQNGVWRNRFRFPDRDSFRDVREWSVDNGLEFTLHTLYTETDNGHGPGETALSPEQREVLEAAHEAGLYEIPQRASASDLADELDVSPQAISERLHRAHSTLVEEHII